MGNLAHLLCRNRRIRGSASLLRRISADLRRRRPHGVGRPRHLRPAPPARRRARRGELPPRRFARAGRRAEPRQSRVGADRARRIRRSGRRARARSSSAGPLGSMRRRSSRSRGSICAHGTVSMRCTRKSPSGSREARPTNVSRIRLRRCRCRYRASGAAARGRGVDALLAALAAAGPDPHPSRGGARPGCGWVTSRRIFATTRSPTCSAKSGSGTIGRGSKPRVQHRPPAKTRRCAARIERAFDRFHDAFDETPARTAQRIRDDGIDVLDRPQRSHARRAQRDLRDAAGARAVELARLSRHAGRGLDRLRRDRPLRRARSAAAGVHRALPLSSGLLLPQRHAARDRAASAARAPTPACRSKAFVFCCFNNTYKILPAVFDVWMRLLDARPAAAFSGSRRARTTAMANLRREAARARDRRGSAGVRRARSATRAPRAPRRTPISFSTRRRTTPERPRTTRC